MNDLFGRELFVGDWVVCPRQMGRGQTLKPALITDIEKGKLFLRRYGLAYTFIDISLLEKKFYWQYELEGHTVHPERLVFYPVELLPSELLQLASVPASQEPEDR